MKTNSLILLIMSPLWAISQTPEITSWLINTTGLTGSHYISNNPTLIQDQTAANVQLVQYSDQWVYISATGIPSYPTGPFLDGNPSLATSQNGIFKISRNPIASITDQNTTPGNIGVFINGVALFDYRDGVAWNPNTNSLCGGPGNPPCPGGPGSIMDWNRDAILAERQGFDCAKGHPAMGNYHHHQNPSAFDLDLITISDICSMYDADGLYTIDSTNHSPLIGFAYDGFPIYGAYGYKNEDGSGELTRIKSSYVLRDITERTSDENGQSVSAGPPINNIYPLGYFREDYRFDSTLSASPEYLDEHNGRFCITPEYPQGNYCYFATVDANWNSAYPYVVGPTFYGVNSGSKVTTIGEPTETYSPLLVKENDTELSVSVHPNPASDYIAIQTHGILVDDLPIQIIDSQGKCIHRANIKQGSTIAIIDTTSLYNGIYHVSTSINSIPNLCSFVIMK